MMKKQTSFSLITSRLMNRAINLAEHSGAWSFLCKQSYKRSRTLLQTRLRKGALPQPHRHSREGALLSGLN